MGSDLPAQAALGIAGPSSMPAACDTAPSTVMSVSADAGAATAGGEQRGKGNPGRCQESRQEERAGRRMGSVARLSVIEWVRNELRLQRTASY